MKAWSAVSKQYLYTVIEEEIFSALKVYKYDLFLNGQVH